MIQATYLLLSEPDRTILGAMSETEHGPGPDSTGRSCRPPEVCFLSYKSLRSGKLAIKLSPQDSSQRCGLQTMPIITTAASSHKEGSVFFWKGRSRRKRFGGAGTGNSKHQDRGPVSKPPERAMRRKGSQSYSHPRRKRNIRSCELKLPLKR